MPSSPDEWTATPSWNVSHTPAAFTHGRMPPQKVVSSRITSTAVFSTLAASCSKLTTTVLVAERHAHLLAHAAHAVQAEDGVFEIVVVEILDRLAEPDRLLGRPDAVRDRSGTRSPGQRRGDGAIALQLVLRGGRRRL